MNANTDDFTLSTTAAQECCEGILHPLARKGMHLINQGAYFEAHEALELAWREEHGVVREMYRGVLQVSVACYHMQRGNYDGAVKMLRRAAMWLRPYPDLCRGVNLGRFRQEANRIESALLASGRDGLHSLAQGIALHIDVEENS